MKYEEMTMNQIDEITRRGGDQLRKLNKAVADYLDGLDLSEKARDQISQTDFNNMADVFGGCFTSEEVEEVVKSYCEDQKGAVFMIKRLEKAVKDLEKIVYI